MQTFKHTRDAFDTPPFLPLRTSGTGVVPKKDGGHRLIMHGLPFAGNSVNDFIDQDLARVGETNNYSDLLACGRHPYFF